MKTKYLSEVTNIKSGNSAPQGEEPFVNGKYNFYRTYDVGQIKQGEIFESRDKVNKETYSNLKIFPVNTILFPKSGASTFNNNRVIIKKEGAIASHLAGIKANSEFLNDYYLYYFLLTIDAKNLVQDSAYPSVNLKQISQIEIPVPSLQEQEKIVDRLDKVFENIDKLIEDTAKNIEFSKILYGKVLDDHFNFENKKNTFISVSELVDSGILQKPFDGNHGEQHPKASDYVDNGVPFLMASDLKNGLVDTVNCKFIPNTIAKNLRIDSSKNNDILLTHKGTIGRTAILKTDLDLVVLTPQVTSYRILNENILLRDYLFNYFKSPYFQKILFTIAKGGSTRAYIGITKQLDLLIPIPDLETQKNTCKNIYDFENNYFKLSENLNNKITKLIELKSSILNNQFNPELYKVVA